MSTAATDYTQRQVIDELAEAYASDVRISRLPYRDSIYIGLLQILSLLAGISRSGVSMVGGLWRGLDHDPVGRDDCRVRDPMPHRSGAKHRNAHHHRTANP